ncbi:MAG: TMEM43 family protein [Deltaproteobacteria bacterium]|nr:TMEM43 family protein [Deltaproteobacteria bacterium]
MESIKAVLVGAFLFLVSIPLLWWNEGRAVQTYNSLNEGSGAVVSVPNDKVDAANDGKLVHVTGKAVTTQTLTDPDFGVSAQGALRMSRNVQMYQWVQTEKSEKKKKLGGGEETITTYSYSKDWKSDVVDSSKFKEPRGHQNPAAMPHESERWRASPVTLGAFTMTDSLVDRVSGEEKIVVTPEMVKMDAKAAEAAAAAPPPAAEEEKKEEAAPPPAAKGKGKAAKPGKLSKAMAKANKGDKGAKGKPAPAAAAKDEPKMAAKPSGPKVVDGGIYLGYGTAGSPEVGDVKVAFTRVPSSEVSVIAQQKGSSFQPYQTKAGDALNILQGGIKTSAEMFTQAQADNATLTWILRFLFFVLMTVGVFTVFKPLAVVADVVPVLGDILRWGLGVVAVAISAPVTLLTIAFAWIFYRPLLGSLLLVVAIGAFVGIKVLASKKKAAGAVPA